MDFGFYLPSSGPTARPEPLAEIARRGDRLGFHCMVAGDHILVPKTIDSPYPYTVGGEFPSGASGEFLEQLTLLTFLVFGAVLLPTVSGGVDWQVIAYAVLSLTVIRMVPSALALRS